MLSWQNLVREIIPKNQKAHEFAIQKQSVNVCKKISNRPIPRKAFCCASMRALHFDANPIHSLQDLMEKSVFSLFKKCSINYYHDVKLFLLLLYKYLRTFCMKWNMSKYKWRPLNVWKVAAFCGTWCVAQRKKTHDRIPFSYAVFTSG